MCNVKIRPFPRAPRLRILLGIMLTVSGIFGGLGLQPESVTYVLNLHRCNFDFFVIRFSFFSVATLEILVKVL